MLAVFGLLAGLGLTACEDAVKDERVRSGKLQVVTTFTILADMAREVAGDAAEVSSITHPGAEVHGYEPTPKDILRAQQADLILWNGMNLELWFERFFANLKDVDSVLLTEGIEPMSIAEGAYLGKPNPHAWMSPGNAVIYVENIRKALVKADPANAQVYDRNAAEYVAKIRALDEPVRKQLERIPESQRWLVTSEGAFSYLCQDYGLKPLYLWPINADGQATPRRIREVVDQVREHRIPVMFSESTISDKPARQVCEETGIRYGGVLYVDSLTGPDGAAPTYLKLLETNAKTIVDGFLNSAHE